MPEALEPVKHPCENPASREKIALGRTLFFDTRLSRDNRVSCASCHDPGKGFSNGQRLAVGVGGRKGTRNSPSLINVGYSDSFFWDGRADTLEEQALQPIQNPKEMDMPLDDLVERLNGIDSYRKQFRSVFGGKVTAKRIGRAVAAFQRTLVSNDTPFDQFLGGDKDAMSAGALRGMRLFYGQARCAVCHRGPNFTDDQFHNIGTADPGLQDDPGRRAVSGKVEDQGAFRTPQLREVARTAPYMHSGRFETLEEVVEHYNFGGVTDEANKHRDEELQVLYLSEEQVEDLVTFLKEGLTSRDPDWQDLNREK